MLVKMTSKQTLNKSRPLSADRKKEGEKRSKIGERGSQKEKFVCYLSISFFICFFNYLFFDQRFNCQITRTIQLVSGDIFNNYKDNVL